MRYTLQLEMLEQSDALGDEQATALLRSEFALAQNAGRFNALTGRDIELGTVTRSTPQEGVARYTVECIVRERAGLDDGRVITLLRQALTDAFNASYFLRLCENPLTLRLVSRVPAVAPAGAPAELRFAA